MAIYTFSTKATRPTDTEVVERIKEKCLNQGLNFSALVVTLLKDWEESVNVERRAKIQSTQ